MPRGTPRIPSYKRVNAARNRLKCNLNVIERTTRRVQLPGRGRHDRDTVNLPGVLAVLDPRYRRQTVAAAEMPVPAPGPGQAMRPARPAVARKARAR